MVVPVSADKNDATSFTLDSPLDSPASSSLFPFNVSGSPSGQNSFRIHPRIHSARIPERHFHLHVTVRVSCSHVIPASQSRKKRVFNMCRRPLLGGPVHKLGANSVGRRRLKVGSQSVDVYDDSGFRVLTNMVR